MLESAAPARADDNQVDAEPLGFLFDDRGRVTLPGNFLHGKTSLAQPFSIEGQLPLGLLLDGVPEIGGEISPLDLLEFYGEVVGMKQHHRTLVFLGEVGGPLDDGVGVFRKIQGDQDQSDLNWHSENVRFGGRLVQPWPNGGFGLQKDAGALGGGA